MRKRLYGFIKENRVLLVIMLLLLLEHLAATYELGITYSLQSDDASYIRSGIFWANTGTITMHAEVPSAQIMPGMTVLIGLLSLVFGEGKLLYLVLKLLWMAFSLLTAYYVYKSVKLFAPTFCAVLATLFLFRPDFVWMDNLILTETPFMAAFTGMIYFTLKMGKDDHYKNFWGCAACYMAGLVLKANIALYPLFALAYLLVVKYDRKRLLKQCGILALVVLCFVVPWSIRNYIHFSEFIPLTDGAGNPMLLGTYQGVGYPDDADLDYETNVGKVARARYQNCFDEDGNVLQEYARHFYLRTDAIKAKYRLKEWWSRSPVSLIYSYLVSKPKSMLRSIFYWNTVFGVNADAISWLPDLELLLCGLFALVALIRKKHRAPIFFALAVYIGNIYIYAMTFAFDRYAASITSAKYIALGIGMGLIFGWLADHIRTKKAQPSKQTGTTMKE